MNLPQILLSKFSSWSKELIENSLILINILQRQESQRESFQTLKLTAQLLQFLSSGSPLGKDVDIQIQILEIFKHSVYFGVERKDFIELGGINFSIEILKSQSNELLLLSALELLHALMMFGIFKNIFWGIFINFILNLF